VFEIDKAVKTDFIDDRYMQEKVDNIIRFYTDVLGNFKSRMMHSPELRKKFIEFMKAEYAHFDIWVYDKSDRDVTNEFLK